MSVFVCVWFFFVCLFVCFFVVRCLSLMPDWEAEFQMGHEYLDPSMGKGVGGWGKGLSKYVT